MASRATTNLLLFLILVALIGGASAVLSVALLLLMLFFTGVVLWGVFGDWAVARRLGNELEQRFMRSPLDIGAIAFLLAAIVVFFLLAAVLNGV